MLTDGLLGYWPFDGTTADASGNGNDLALFGDATFASGGLFGGLALSVHYTGLGGPDGGAEALSNNPAFDFSAGNFTIQLWAKFNNINDGRQEALIEKLTGAPAPGWGVTMPSEDLEFDSSNVPRSSGPLQIPNGIWQEFVITGDGNTVSFYWNGTAVFPARAAHRA
jgi:Concanavalin A-like lectin/glucanases superfamily